MAKERLRTVFDRDFLLLDEGRHSEEKSVVLVQDGHFAGFGYISTEEAANQETLMEAVKTYPGYPDTARIIQRFISDHPKAKVIPL